MNLVIEITRRCNQNCIYCFAEKEGARDIALSDIQKLVDTVVMEENIDTVILTGGEPLIHPNFKEILELVSGKASHVIVLSNGLEIYNNNELLECLEKYNVEIHISLDSVKSDYHDRLRGNQKKIMSAIEMLAQKNLKVQTIAVLSRENIEEIPYIDRYVESLGVTNDYELISTKESYGMQYAKNDEKKELVQKLRNWAKQNDNWTKYLLIKRIVYGKPVNIKRCYFCKHYLILTADGCLRSCFLQDKYYYGHITEVNSIEKAIKKMDEIKETDCFNIKCIGVFV